MRGQVLSVEQVSWHRNGVGGIGFHAVLFRSDIEGSSEEEAERWGFKASPPQPNALFLGIVFDDPGACAVICVDRILTDGVRFGANSWRGDTYEPELRQAIENETSAGSVRMGPFGIPTP